jgi:hypothetical protein
MISNEQKNRAEREFVAAAAAALPLARDAEREREHQNFLSSPHYNPTKARAAQIAFDEADYIAESRAYVRDLIRADLAYKHRPALPASAVCFFKDGDRWCCVNADFVNLMGSPAGFGETFADALTALEGELSLRSEFATA